MLNLKFLIAKKKKKERKRKKTLALKDPTRVDIL